jgi:hypothetical protein
MYEFFSFRFLTTEAMPPCFHARHATAHDQIFGTVRQLSFCQSGALADERSGLSFIIVLVSLLSIKFNIYSLLCKRKNYIYTRPLSVQAENSRSCPILSSSGYNGSLVTWTVVRLTAAKFKPLVFSRFLRLHSVREMPWYDSVALFVNAYKSTIDWYSVECIRSSCVE